MKQKKLHRKGSSDCSVLDTITSPLSLPGESTFGDDDPRRSDVINMAACGHVTVESSSAFEQKHQQLYGDDDDDDDDDDDINVDSSATESESDL